MCVYGDMRTKKKTEKKEKIRKIAIYQTNVNTIHAGTLYSTLMLHLSVLTGSPRILVPATP